MTLPPTLAAPGDQPGTRPDAPEREPMVPASRSTKTMVLITGAFILGAVTGILLPVGSPGLATGEVSASPSPTTTSTPLADAYDLCNVSDDGGAIADEQTTLILDTQGEDDAGGVDYTTVACVLSQLETPERVTQAMNSTRALDGRLTDSWDSFTASWSYHPDTGLDLVISTH